MSCLLLVTDKVKSSSTTNKHKTLERRITGQQIKLFFNGREIWHTASALFIQQMQQMATNGTDNMCHLNAGLGSCLLIKLCSSELTHVRSSNTSQVTSA